MSWINLHRPAYKTELNKIVNAYNERVTFFRKYGDTHADFLMHFKSDIYGSTQGTNRFSYWYSNLLACIKKLLMSSIPLDNRERKVVLYPWKNHIPEFLKKNKMPLDLFAPKRLDCLLRWDDLQALYIILNDWALYPTPIANPTKRHVYKSFGKYHDWVSTVQLADDGMFNFQNWGRLIYPEEDEYDRMTNNGTMFDMQKYELYKPLRKSSEISYCWAGWLDAEGWDEPVTWPSWSFYSDDYDGSRFNAKIPQSGEFVVMLPNSFISYYDWTTTITLDYNPFSRFYNDLICAKGHSGMRKFPMDLGYNNNHENAYTTMKLSRKHFEDPAYKYWDK